MSFVSHDLLCEDGHQMPAEIYRRANGPPPCEVCGKPTRTAWFSGRAPASVGFGTVNVDGKTMTTGELDQMTRELKAKNPGKEVRITALSDNQVDQRIAERRQRIIDSRKARGIDVEAVAEQRVEAAEKQLEAAERGSLPPAKVQAAREKVVKTAESFKNST